MVSALQPGPDSCFYCETGQKGMFPRLQNQACELVSQKDFGVSSSLCREGLPHSHNLRSCVGKELYCIYAIIVVFCSAHNFPTAGHVAE